MKVNGEESIGSGLAPFRGRSTEEAVQSWCVAVVDKAGRTFRRGRRLREMWELRETAIGLDWIGVPCFTIRLWPQTVQ